MNGAGDPRLESPENAPSAPCLNGRKMKERRHVASAHRPVQDRGQVVRPACESLMDSSSSLDLRDALRHVTS
jgi:hypothetical protein